MALRAEMFRIPPVFPEPNPIELTPYHQAYDKYVSKRIQGIQEALKSQDTTEELYYIAIEYIELEFQKEKLGTFTPSQQIQFEVLHAIIFDSGYFVPLDEIREIYKKRTR